MTLPHLLFTQDQVQPNLGSRSWEEESLLEELLELLSRKSREDLSQTQLDVFVPETKFSSGMEGLCKDPLLKKHMTLWLNRGRNLK